MEGTRKTSGCTEALAVRHALIQEPKLSGFVHFHFSEHGHRKLQAHLAQVLSIRSLGGTQTEKGDGSCLVLFLSHRTLALIWEYISAAWERTSLKHRHQRPLGTSSAICRTETNSIPALPCSLVTRLSIASQ